jgi:hypothetical protein
MNNPWLAVSCLILAIGCGSTPSAQPDAATPTSDAPVPDAAIPTGFGAVTGQCGDLDDVEWTGASPLWFQGNLDFAADRYDDPADRPRLTAGGIKIVSSDNAGGSSVFSEAFAFEWLARCEQATLLKTETEIAYDTVSKKADLLVEIDSRKVGVSVTRAVAFPFGTRLYTQDEAKILLERKLKDIALATTSVSLADRWSRTMISVLSYDAQHASVAMQAWAALPADTKSDTILVVTVTDGDDTFIYTDR